MSKKVFNMQGGKHSAAAYTELEKWAYGSIVANAASFVVSAGTGMNLNISTGAGLISDTIARRIGTDAVETAAVPTASASFNRIDTVVAYIDTAVAPTTAVTDNTNDILKFKVVAGTAASTPVAPTGAAIITSIGAGKPYMVLYDVLVPQNATNTSGMTFTDRRVLMRAVSASDIPTGAISTAKIANDAVDYTKLAAGTVLQMVQTDFTNTLAAGAIIPYDNTTPQITEGMEVMTRSITPKLSTSDLIVEASIYGSINGSGASEFEGAIFRDAIANALAAQSVTIAGAGYLNTLRVSAKVTAGSTAATTFRVRIGCTDGRNVSFNGYASGTIGVVSGVYNTASRSSLRVTEVKA